MVLQSLARGFEINGNGYVIVCGARVASPPRVTVEFELVRALAHERRRAGEGPPLGGREGPPLGGRDEGHHDAGPPSSVLYSSNSRMQDAGGNEYLTKVQEINRVIPLAECEIVLVTWCDESKQYEPTPEGEGLRTGGALPPLNPERRRPTARICLNGTCVFRTIGFRKSAPPPPPRMSFWYLIA
eukprot:CAMPEP_0119533400 /NCGR_PEP_ID=MMETSP1344-20130328/46807_1 /TAXON_ID=236787 /ORGANISM="Florenciella parvula, Strain CCMP2471" /LENGTH=184 /DNA_ID=CAMNT_0007574275 /DNA_START=167 /DNA_END=718 /DNA_ORIENTATION=+